MKNECSCCNHFCSKFGTTTTTASSSSGSAAEHASSVLLPRKQQQPKQENQIWISDQPSAVWKFSNHQQRSEYFVSSSIRFLLLLPVSSVINWVFDWKLVTISSWCNHLSIPINSIVALIYKSTNIRLLWVLPKLFVCFYF